MTEQQVVAALQKLVGEDREYAHREAEEILCKFLRANGHTKVADAFDYAREAIGFWYA